MEWSEKSDQIGAALLEAQRELGPVKKDGRNPHFKSTYASLNAVWETCAPVLHAHDCVVVQAPSITEQGDVLVTEIRHKSGQWVRGVLRLNPQKNDPQGIGSAITYARRYSLCAMLGLMQEDDDGNAASARPKSGGGQRKPSPKQPVDENFEVKVDTMGTRKALKDCAEDELYFAYSNLSAAATKDPRAKELKEIAEEIMDHNGWEAPPFIVTFLVALLSISYMISAGGSHAIQAVFQV